ncbi:MAG: putative minor capsid protein [Phycisphaerae bacterium]|jgi:hypothetical protein
MSKSIPKRLLPHSATHNYGAKVKDDWGNLTHASSRALTHVLFEPTSKLIKSKDNREIQLSALMYFDCRNSSPEGATFAIGDQIIRGAAYEVVGGIDPIRDGTHYEVELS